jgi:hypothetical protein
MLGRVLTVLYASLTRPTPRAAARTIVRTSPVIRETSVAIAMVPAARRMPRLAPGAPSRSDASSSVSPCVGGTGGSDVITCVSSAAGTQRPRGGGGGGAATCGGGTSGASATEGSTAGANGVDRGGAAR